MPDFTRFSLSQSPRKKYFAVFPTLLTLGNAVCGFATITYAAKIGPEPATAHDFYTAALFIFAAMVFDALDGPVARLSKQTSTFGAELDSLCDAISFGAAPAFLMLSFCQAPWLPPRILWLIAVLYMVCAVLRLARFNVGKLSDDNDYFKGLPSPAAAGTVASLVVIAPGLANLAETGMTHWARELADSLRSISVACLPLVTLAVAVLMVSRIRYNHLFNQMFKGRRSFRHLVNSIFILVAIFAVHELAVPLIFFYYVAGAPLVAGWKNLFSSKTEVPVTPTSASNGAPATPETSVNGVESPDQPQI